MDSESESDATPDSQRWLWDSLHSVQSSSLLIQRLAPRDFDWNCAHHWHGTPLMATVNEIVRSGKLTPEVKATLYWCMSQGADPRTIAPASTVLGHSGGWGDGQEFPKVPAVEHGDHCAISLVQALLKYLEWIHNYEHKGKYQAQVVVCRELLNLFADFRPKSKFRSKPESWCTRICDAIRSDMDSTDVEIHLLPLEERKAQHSEPQAEPDIWRWQDEGSKESKIDSDSGCEVLRAHSHFLRAASPVLSALLSSAMKEGRSWVISVPVEQAAADLLLCTIYTGEVPTLPAEESGTISKGCKSYAVGETVEGNYRHKGWWKAKVTHRNDDGTYRLDYLDGNYKELWVPANRIRQLETAQAFAQAAQVTDILTDSGHLVSSLDLAHRWQVDVSVDILEEAIVADILEGRFSTLWKSNAASRLPAETNAKVVEHFTLCLEKSLSLQLPNMRDACRRLAGQCPQVKASYKEGAFPDAVMRELHSSCF